MKNIRYYFIITLLLITAWLPDHLDAQPLSWKTYTSHTEIRDMVALGNDIWAVTGGGVFRFETAAGEFTLFNNTNGLTSVNPSSVAMDDDGVLWIGMDDGTLNTVDPANLDIGYVTIDPEPLNVNDLIYQDGALFLALDIGVSYFLVDKQEVNSTFRHLGDFPINTPVHKLFIMDNTLWAATEQGLAAADLSSPNLQDPQYWRNYTVQQGLTSNIVNDFTEKNDTLFAATTSGISRYAGGGFTGDGISGQRIRALAVRGNSVYAAGRFAVYERTGLNSWTPLQPALENASTLAEDNGGSLWAGHLRDGLYRYDHDTAVWNLHSPAGPAGNTFETMILDSENRLWCATGQSANNGVYMFDGAEWRRFNTADGLSSNNSTGIVEAPDGSIWAGTPGQGLNILDFDGTSLDVTVVDHMSGLLTGADTPSFVVIPDLIRDRNDVIWLINKFADNGRALVAVTPDNEWHYFSVNDGLSSSILVRIAADELDRIWVATAENGVDILDYGGTLDNKGDDLWDHVTTRDGLSSNMVTGLAVEEGNGVWVSTIDGINHVIPGFLVQEVPGALSTVVNTVAVDPAHNKWFGTDKGISILRHDETTWQHYMPDDSYLVSEKLVYIYFHGPSGSAYIGTQGGLSVVSTPFKSTVGTDAEISAFPNPYILDGSGTEMTIENVRLRSTVKIFSVSGRLIKELTEDNGGVFGTQAYWNGTDTDGSPVPTGVYIIVAGTESSGAAVHKVAVVRK